MARARGWWPIAATVLALVVANVASNRLVPHAAYAPFALVVAGLLVWFARWADGRSWADLGMDRADVRAGVVWGGVPALAVTVGYVVVFVVPATHDVFLDDRVEHSSFAGMLVAAMVRVPLGTVVLEEVAFRSVLPAELATRTTRWVSYGMSSVLFGLWHVLPALGLETVNPVAIDTVGATPGALVVAGSVVATAVAGLFFCWLRDRSNSLVAPIVLHWTTNSMGYLFAWVAWRGV